MSTYPFLDKIVSDLTMLVSAVKSAAGGPVASEIEALVPSSLSFIQAVLKDSNYAGLAINAVPEIEAAIAALQKMNFKPADWDSPVRQEIESEHRTEG